MQKGNIGVTTENIFPVIKKFLYSDHEIFLREMISNAVDATQKMKTLAERGDFKGELGDLSVRVSIDSEKKTLTISDRGIGMTAEEIDKYINQIAFSGVTDFLDKYKDNANAIIGHFGLGFYSAFMVSDKVEIVTHIVLKTVRNSLKNSASKTCSTNIASLCLFLLCSARKPNGKTEKWLTRTKTMSSTTPTPCGPRHPVR